MDTQCTGSQYITPHLLPQVDGTFRGASLKEKKDMDASNASLSGLDGLNGHAHRPGPSAPVGIGTSGPGGSILDGSNHHAPATEESAGTNVVIAKVMTGLKANVANMNETVESR